MDNPPPRAAYHALMACHIIELDKRTGVFPVEIGEALHRAITKLVIMAAGDQAKTACGSLQLCAGLEADIEGETYTVVQRRQERTIPVLEGGADEESTDENMVAAGGAERLGGADIVGGVGEVMVTSGEQRTPEEGEGGANEEIRTTMEGMEVGRDDMD